MQFEPLALAGAWLIRPEPIRDERGFFARSFCAEEFAAHGLKPDFVQCNISFNARRGTLRGMHFQRPPHEEAKLVRCTAGAIHDVIVDLRPGSPTRGQWVAAELSAENRHMLYVPEGFAHGFKTLADGTEVFYQMGSAFVPGAGAGLRHDDPALAIDWPPGEIVISDKDLSYPDFDSLAPESLAAPMRAGRD